MNKMTNEITIPSPYPYPSKPKVNVDVRRNGIESAYVVAPFDKAKEVLENAGYRIISLEENAQLRIQEGLDSDISKFGNYVREGFIYTPLTNKRLITKRSPIINYPQEAVYSNEHRQDFCLSREQLEEALSDSIEQNDEAVYRASFSEHPIMRFSFGDIAEAYKDFLPKDFWETGFQCYGGDYTISVPARKSILNVPGNFALPIARQIRFPGIQEKRQALFETSGKTLGFDGRVRGIKNIPREVTK